ncbi:MAG: hypothetical protein AB8B85_09690 [Paracoccaceae bacterium]
MDDISGQASVFGGQSYNGGSTVDLLGVEGSVMLRFSKNFGIQADAQIARLSTEGTN